MGILERLRRLIASNVNALFESLTDPGSQIDELVANMEAAARDARGQVVAAITEDRRTARLEESTRKSIGEWTSRAERAVSAGDDALAKEALAKRAELEELLVTIANDRTKAKTDQAELTRGLRELDAKIAAVKARKETLKVIMRSRAAGGGAVERYENIVTGVDVAEAEVELGRDLGDSEHSGATEEIRQRIDKLSSDREVDERLAALKEKMKK